MTGTPLRGKARFPLRSLIFLLLGLTLLGIGVFNIQDTATIGLILFAIWPLSLAVITYIQSRKRFSAELGDAALLTHLPSETEIPYRTIEAVQAESPGKRNYPLHVHHAEGILLIPKEVGVATSDLVTFLRSWLPRAERHDLPIELQPYFDQQSAKFGPDKVFAYLPRRRQSKSDRGQFGRALGLSCAFTGACWIMLSLILTDPKMDFTGWRYTGVFFLFLGLILFWIFTKHREMPGGQKKWQASGLVVSPVGLAMIQGKTQGEMKWAELKQLIYPTKKAFLDVDAISRVGNIRLDFGGGAIEILDIYNHPLSTIHETIQFYWKG